MTTPVAAPWFATARHALAESLMPLLLLLALPLRLPVPLQPPLTCDGVVLDVRLLIHAVVELQGGGRAGSQAAGRSDGSQ
jgi:hypothetical protein